MRFLSSQVVLETLHLPDRGDSENVLEMPKADYAKVTRHTANIIADKCTMVKDINPVSRIPSRFFAPFSLVICVYLFFLAPR